VEGACLKRAWSRHKLENDEQAKAAVSDALKDKDALLILDNFDEVLQKVLPGCYVLVTAREEELLKKAFGLVDKKYHIKLEGFGLQDARELFYNVCERTFNDDDKGVVDQMLGLMGGMPLAIKIAAHAVSDALPTAQLTSLLAQLRDNLDGLCLDELPDEDRAHYNVKGCLMMSFKSLANDPERQGLEWMFDAASACASGGFYKKALFKPLGSMTTWARGC